MEEKSYTQQTIDVPLEVGGHVVLFDVAEVNDDGTYSTSIFFQDTVSKYVPESGLLEFEDSDIGLARFESMLEGAHGVKIARNP